MTPGPHRAARGPAPHGRIRPHPLIDPEDVGDATVARVLIDEIRDPEAAGVLGRSSGGSSTQHGRTRIVVDLNDFRYISSTAFAAILGLAKRLGEHGGKIALCRVHPDVLVGARIIGIEQFAPIHATEAEALAAVGG